jgi:hypothetical protein
MPTPDRAALLMAALLTTGSKEFQTVTGEKEMLCLGSDNGIFLTNG